MSDPNHPIWPIVRLTILMTALTITLWLTASNFDYTEIRTIIITFLFAGTSEGVLKAYQQRSKA